MSVALWAYEPTICDGDFCEGECDLCPKTDEALALRNIPRGTYQCFHCGSYSVVWGADFDFSDYGYEGEGIVHSCHCVNCGADIEYRVRLDDDDTM